LEALNAFNDAVDSSNLVNRVFCVVFVVSLDAVYAFNDTLPLLAVNVFNDAVEA
jgi:hypothetical protein